MLKSLKEIYGFIELNNKKYPFVFSTKKFKVTLYPPNADQWGKYKISILRELTELRELKKLKGVTAEEYLIIFDVCKCSMYNGFLTYNVNWCAYNETLNFDFVKGLRMSGGDINRFYSEKTFDLEINDNLNRIELFFSLNRDKKPSEKYSIDNGIDAVIDINSIISIDPMIAKNSINTKRGINIEYSTGINIDLVIRNIEHLYQFFAYTFYRDNISIPDIELLGKYDDRMFVIGRVLLKDYFNIKMEDNIDAERSVINYEYWKTNMSKILTDIKTGNIILQHICGSIDNRRYFTKSRILSILAAFEGEFRNIYGFGIDKIRSSDFKEVKNFVVEELKDYSSKKEYSRKKKKYIQEMIKYIDNYEVQYKDRVYYSLNECKDVMEFFVAKYCNGYGYNGLYNEFAHKMADYIGTLRNELAHGNTECEIEKIKIRYIEMIEILLYAMRLKKYSENINLIQKSIKDLFLLS
ncbi:MAG: hypothetical protein IJK61_02945 [Bacteroidetes bacterium]|nr:hypothetical protein [Bacteroidota bacterium]